MDIPCRSSWIGSHEIFQAREYDAGASQISSEMEQAQCIFEHMMNCLKKLFEVDAPNI
jgi:hypothetical protein